MLRLGLILWLLALGATAWSQPCTVKRLASLPFAPGRDGSPIVKVVINDVEQNFLVDTAAPFTAIDERVAQAMALPERSVQGTEIYAGGKAVNRYVVARRVLLGITEFTNLGLLRLSPGELGPGIDGIVGADLLRNFDLDFDFARNALNLYSKEHCKGAVVYWTRDYTTVPFELSESQHLFFPVTLDGTNLSAIADTGSGHTALSETVAGRKFDLTAQSPGSEPVPGARPDGPWRFQHRFDILTFEGISARRPLIRVRADVNERAFNRKHIDKTQISPVTRVELDHEDVDIGMDLLRKLHLYVCYDENLLYISAAGAH
jgi:predicted aspartyl protease